MAKKWYVYRIYLDKDKYYEVSYPIKQSKRSLKEEYGDLRIEMVKG